MLEYGKREGKLKESLKLSPITNYGFGKYLLKKTLELQNKKFNFTWLRLFYMYGNKQPDRTLYTQFINAIKKRKKFLRCQKVSNLEIIFLQKK